MNKPSAMVIGAMGRVGLPLTMELKKTGYDVYGYDINENAIDMYERGYMPFYENGGQGLLDQMHTYGHIQMFSNANRGSFLRKLEEVDYIIITLGTPIDEHGNPSLDALIDFFSSDILLSHIKDGTTIILRSTVAPGTTDTIFNILKGRMPVKFNIVFAPERISQGNALTELHTLPQLIGAYDTIGYLKAESFFLPLLNYDKSKVIRLTPKEAEFAKLTTNMYRYINFAFANEIYMLASKQGVDAHKIIQAANFDYPRMNMPLPGPNVGGPCLYKDGRFLVTDEPFADLIQISFQINEAMPNFVLNRVLALNPNVKSVCILGEAFKAGNDDTRNSLSFKLRKILKRKGIMFASYDPMVNKSAFDNYVTRLSTPGVMYEFDAYIIMTNHPEFKYVYELIKKNATNQDVVIADAWKMLDDSKHFHDGIFKMRKETI